MQKFILRELKFLINLFVPFFGIRKFAGLASSLRKMLDNVNQLHVAIFTFRACQICHCIIYTAVSSPTTDSATNRNTSWSIDNEKTADKGPRILYLVSYPIRRMLRTVHSSG